MPSSYVSRSSDSKPNSNSNSYSKPRSSSSSVTPFCKVCYDAGYPSSDYTSHFVKDQPGPNGKVICPTLLAQPCLKCGVSGHTSSYCPENGRREMERRESVRANKDRGAAGGWQMVTGSKPMKYPRIEDMVPRVTDVVQKNTTTRGGSFAALAVSDASSSESDHENEVEDAHHASRGVPKPVRKEAEIVTGPPPAVEAPKPLTWAQRAAAGASASVTATAAVSTHKVAEVVDMRFQFHSLCENIETIDRSKKAKSLNHRQEAALVAVESSNRKKRTFDVEKISIPA